MKKCPYCVEDIQDSAIKCKHCGEMLVKKKKKMTSAKPEGCLSRILFLIVVFAGIGIWKDYVKPFFSRGATIAQCKSGTELKVGQVYSSTDGEIHMLAISGSEVQVRLDRYIKPEYYIPYDCSYSFNWNLGGLYEMRSISGEFQEPSVFSITTNLPINVIPPTVDKYSMIPDDEYIWNEGTSAYD